jgi:hypothetical protein
MAKRNISLSSVNSGILAFERMLTTYEELKLSYPESRAYIEDRQFKLNCEYADLLVLREDLKERASV